MYRMHEWGVTAMFELGTADSVPRRDAMGEEIWDVEVFLVCDHYSLSPNPTPKPSDKCNPIPPHHGEDLSAE
jgi:hypothetical protein